MRCHRLVRLFALGLVVLGLGGMATPARAATAGYTVTDIGTLVGTGDGQFDSLTSVAPADLNNNGLVVANSYPADSTFWSVPFTNDNGKVRRLGKEQAYSSVSEMNDAGDIAGWTTSLGDTTLEHGQATVWRKRKPVALPGLGGDFSSADGINSAGDVVGRSYLEPGQTAFHAVVWKDDRVTDLGTLGGEKSSAFAINSDGMVVGLSQLADRGGTAACVWVDGKATELKVPDESLNGAAFDINAAGIIIGIAIDPVGSDYPVRWIDRKPEYLPTLADYPTGVPSSINAAGLIVGASPNAKGDDVAVLWDGASVTDLNALIPADGNQTLTNAQAINDDGQILVTVTGNDGSRRGALLNPVDQSASHLSGVVAALTTGDLARRY